jgi:transposase
MEAINQHVGLDVHKKFIYGVVIDDKGNLLFEQKIKNEPHELDKFIHRINKDSNVALESCSCWEYVYDYLDDAGFTNLKLANPSRVGLIAKSRKKTDAHDALVLANLVRTEMLPLSYAPPNIIREHRQLTRFRADLARMQTHVKNKIHAILIRNGINQPHENVFSKKGMSYLESLDLSWIDRMKMDEYLQLIRHHELL